MPSRFTANLSISLHGMDLPEDVKLFLLSVAAEQEKASRHELLEEYQKKELPSPRPVSEAGDSPDAEIILPTTVQSSLAPPQNMNLCSQQSSTVSLAPHGYGNFASHVSSPQTSFPLAESSTPAFPTPLQGPRTPAQNSSTGKSTDSAYYSGSNELPPGLSKDRKHVNPAF